MIFDIDSLEADTTYNAIVIPLKGKEEGVSSEVFTFKTEAVPVVVEEVVEEPVVEIVEEAPVVEEEVIEENAEEDKNEKEEKEEETTEEKE